MVTPVSKSPAELVAALETGERLLVERMKSAPASMIEFRDDCAAVQAELSACAASTPAAAAPIVISYYDWLREAEGRYEGVCERVPWKYREPIDQQKLANPGAVEAALAAVHIQTRWRRGKCEIHGQPLDNGLLLYGATGRGKTRTAFAVLQRLALLGIPDFEWVYAWELSKKVWRCALEGPSALDALLLPFKETETLLIDDLSQGKFTRRYAEALLEIVEARTSRGLPIIVTCQATGGRLIEKLCVDAPDLRETAEAIARRFRDFCNPIDFDAMMPAPKRRNA